METQAKAELTRLIRNYANALVEVERSGSDTFAVNAETMRLSSASKELATFVDSL